jgi:hypothetical protein
VTIFDQGMDLAREQIDAGQQAAREARMFAGSGGKSVVAIACTRGFSS